MAANIVPISFDSSWSCIGKMPSYLKSLKYKNPDQPDNTLSHFATGTDFFSYLRNDPARLVRFNSAMKGAGGILASPIPPSLVEAAGAFAGESGVVMVDVGGGIGQVTEKTMETVSNVKGRFIVQDLGKIVDEAREKRLGFEVEEYDFFTEQPVKGETSFSLFLVSHVLTNSPQAPASTSCAASCTTSRTANAARSSRIKPPRWRLESLGS